MAPIENWGVYGYRIPVHGRNRHRETQEGIRDQADGIERRWGSPEELYIKKYNIILEI